MHSWSQALSYVTCYIAESVSDSIAPFLDLSSRRECLGTEVIGAADCGGRSFNSAAVRGSRSPHPERERFCHYVWRAASEQL